LKRPLLVLSLCLACLSLWPFAAFPPAIGLALMAASMGFSQDKSIPPDGAPAGTAPRPVKVSDQTVPPKTPANPARPGVRPEPPQTNFEVRTVEFASFDWRTGLAGRVATIEPASDVPRWLLDERAAGELLVRMRMQRPHGAFVEPDLDLHQPAVVGECGGRRVRCYRYRGELRARHARRIGRWGGDLSCGGRNSPRGRSAWSVQRGADA
jgi:hypothetical protein